jgi:hypothetical protein
MGIKRLVERHWHVGTDSVFRIRTHNETLSSPRCASAIQIVRPLESTTDTQPQLQPALLRLSAIILPVIFLWRAVAQSGMTARLPSCAVLSQMSQRQLSLSISNEGARNYDEGP